MSETDHEEPFERIQEHRSVIRDIQKMKENLDEIESAAKTSEWKALGGLGFVDLDRVDRLCGGVVRSMPYIQGAIHELEGSTVGEEASEE